MAFYRALCPGLFRQEVLGEKSAELVMGGEEVEEDEDEDEDEEEEEESEAKEAEEPEECARPYAEEEEEGVEEEEGADEGGSYRMPEGPTLVSFSWIPSCTALCWTIGARSAAERIGQFEGVHNGQAAF